MKNAGSLGRRQWVGDDELYEVSRVSTWGTFAIVHGAREDPLPAPLAALLRELVALRGYYFDEVRGR